MTSPSPVPPHAFSAPTAPPAAARRRPLPWILVAVLAVVAVVLGTLLLTRGGAGDVEQSGYATPEETIEVFTERLADGDVDGALSTWAGEKQAANLDLVGTLERLRAFTPFDSTILPSGDPAFVELAGTIRAGVAADQLRRLTLSVLLPEIDLTVTTPLDDGDVTAQGIADALDHARLASLRVERVDAVEGPEPHVESLERLAELVGADERREYVVLYECDGETYLGGVGVLRYGDEWSIDTLSAVLAGTPVAVLEPTTVEEYEALLADLAVD